MTNPNNAIGTNAAYGGRTSVNAFNDGLASFSRGVMSGWACTPNTGLTVSLGGSGNVRDVAVAEDNIGDKVTINNISGSPVDVTLPAAPGANSRIDAIVAYADNPPQGESTIADNPGACGIIPVSGIAASSPVPPSGSAIRSAITADGASGTTAYYVVLAYITIAAGTTDIDASSISQSKIPSAKSIADYLNLSVFTDPTITITGGTNISSSNEIHCASNADGSLGKIYGRIGFDTTGANASVSFQTPLRPSSNLTISGTVLSQWADNDTSWSNVSLNSFSLGTDGVVSVPIIGSTAGRARRLTFVACLIFVKDFGDENMPG